MELNIIIDFIKQYGYIALFFFLWLGIVGIPIPDEVVVMIGGFVTSLGLLKLVPSFLVTYCGVVSGLSIGYGLGKIMGKPIMDYLSRKKTMPKHIKKAQDIITKYGANSLIISYFFPVVRHIVPYIVAINRMPFTRYAFYSYTTGLAWTLVYFTAGRYFGHNIGIIGRMINDYCWLSTILFVVIILLVIKIKQFLTRREHYEV